MSEAGKVKLITHLKPMWLHEGLQPMGLTGKKLDDIDMQIPFLFDRVKVHWCDERSFSFAETPEEIHHFETMNGVVYLYAVRENKICSTSFQSPSPEERERFKNPVRRWIRTLLPTLLPPKPLKLDGGITVYDFLVPLDEVHAIMDAFQQDRQNKDYLRWRRNDGLRHYDLVDVLANSPRLLFVDWRECLDDAVEIIKKQLLLYGIELQAEMDETVPCGTVYVQGESAAIRYVPSEDDANFDQVMTNINKLVHEQVQYRRLVSCEGTDGYSYALLSHAEWQKLEAELPGLTDKLFARVGSPYRQ
ncbi:MAG: hypothetical protein KDA65_11755 [Planctomycetaceae bacterium]|nr:hypothetical protein [Planctomycetaceae bacterium]